MTMTRREFVAGTTMAVAAAALPIKLESQPQPSQSDVWQLETQWKDAEWDGHKMRLRCYNGQIPGPMRIVQPGETLRIHLKNSLTPYDSTGWDGNPDVPHMLNTTNLHLHGLNIIPHLFQPVGTSDPEAPMIAIEPGASYDYEFLIPKDQPPGLYWYHPHHHGSTAVQVVTGMAGGIIVHGAIDEVPEIKAARDIPLIVQDLGLFQSEDNPDIWTYEPKQNSIWQTFGGYVTIKGQKTNLRGGFTTGDYKLRYFLLNGKPFFKEEHRYCEQLLSSAHDAPASTCSSQDPIATQLTPPQFELAPGEVVRFRMLNGNSDNMMPIIVEGHDMYLLAIDGNNFEAPRFMQMQHPDSTEPQVLLAPANRAEFLIKAVSTPGTYRIIQLAQDQQFLTSAKKVIAELVVKGPAKNMKLPTRLPFPSRNLPLIQPSEIKRTRLFVFSSAFPGVQNPIVGIDFMINDELYGEFDITENPELNTCEEWHIQVPNSQHGGTEGHPFHIHVNSFEVISVGGVPLPPATIQDVIWVPQNTEAVIRMRFKQWKGKSVYHCHILPHEDTGMMQNFLIRGAQTFETADGRPPRH